jgi:Spy/CpxP family protein refolding chaperone
VRHNWLLYLVIFSLALNLGTIGTFAYLHYQNQPDQALGTAPAVPTRPLWHEIDLDRSQRRTIQGLFPEHRRKVQEIRLQLAEKRQEFFNLIQNDATPMSAIQAKVREINALQGSLEQEMVRFMLAFKKTLTPQQRAIFLNRLQSRLCGPEACRMGPGFGRHRGMGRGMGMGRSMGPRGEPVSSLPLENPRK